LAIGLLTDASPSKLRPERNLAAPAILDGAEIGRGSEMFGAKKGQGIGHAQV
jgi:hypothetical protein